MREDRDEGAIWKSNKESQEGGSSPPTNAAGDRYMRTGLRQTIGSDRMGTTSGLDESSVHPMVGKA